MIQKCELLNTDVLHISVFEIKKNILVQHVEQKRELIDGALNTFE